MIQEHGIKIYGQSDLPVSIRLLEKKIGQEVRTLSERLPSNLIDGLLSSYDGGARYVLVGVPEDIGPRANCGRGGADGGWQAFLSKFLNMQSNRYLNGNDVLVLGHVDLDDVLEGTQSLDNAQDKDRGTLREKCAQIDDLVYPVVYAIVSAGMKPIVIGGGHNNAYPIIKATSDALKSDGRISESGIAAINCDPHLDFRALEGRHSGNPFSYAFNQGHLGAYFAVAIHECYNSEEMLDRIDNINRESERIGYATFEEILIKRMSLREATDVGIKFLQRFNLPIGLELDLDSISGMPVSAATQSGITVEDARAYVQRVAIKTDVPYLHLAEGAPTHSADGKTIVGKTLAYLVSDFIKADKSRAT